MKIFHCATPLSICFIPSIFLLLLASTPAPASASASASEAQSPPSVCIIGSGIGGSSVAHFLRLYSSKDGANPAPPPIGEIRMFERHGVVGGRMARVTIGGETFEAGASILHPKNYHALNFTKYLNLSKAAPSLGEDDDDLNFGIWDGHRFVLKMLTFKSEIPFVRRIISLSNSVLLFVRYGLSLLRMDNFVEVTVNKFLKYYEGFESRPVFQTVEEMLRWSELYNLTKSTLETELENVGLSHSLIQELVTLITRVNYGQSVSISGLAGAVSLAGSGGGLWSVDGGNWQMAAGLIDHSGVELHLHEGIESISSLGKFYELNSTKGKSYTCDVAVVATPLDELNINFVPGISIPKRKLQHTYTTFVKGLLNPVYFGLKTVSDIPLLVGTTETPDVPFSCVAALKQHENQVMTYKVFSRQPLSDSILDQMFSVRNETIRIDWAAYPHYHAPEVFAPFILDGKHLYYVNAFENAASTMETSAVAAENIARLILSRLTGELQFGASDLRSINSVADIAHVDL